MKSRIMTPVTVPNIKFGCVKMRKALLALVALLLAEAARAGAATIPGGQLQLGMEAILTAPAPTNAGNFGYAVSVAGDLAVVGELSADPGGLTNAGAAYVFQRDAGGTNAWTCVATLTAADKAAGDRFGIAVSVAGDTALVGAYLAHVDGVSDAGAAYVFQRNAGGTNHWGQVAKITATDKAASDEFGMAVSLAGDLALVGAYLANPGGKTDAGAAYVFGRNTGGTNHWGQVAKLTASNKAEGDLFGWSVSLAGDVALVGAVAKDLNGEDDTGAAYVFERNAGGTNHWGEVVMLYASERAPGNHFGWSVSVAGDTALVGAKDENFVAATNAGAAYVFERNAGGTNRWGRAAKLTCGPSLVKNARFGCAVSVAGNTALVGAYTPVPGAAGEVYMYERDAGGANAWGQVARFQASDLTASDYFGWSVSLADSLAMVGAYNASVHGGGTRPGKAYIIPLTREGWGGSVKLTASDSVTNNDLGWSVSVAGDVAVAGALYASPLGVSKAGATYVYERNATGGSNLWTQVIKIAAADMAPTDYFGCAVSVAGDVSVVGAMRADPDGIPEAGSAYVFERDAGGTNHWGQVAKLVAADKEEDAEFGRAVSVAGDLALVGAHYANPGGMEQAGAAYLFERDAGGTNAWGQIAKLVAADRQPYDEFGWSVSLGGDLALVGADRSDPGGVTNAGAVYVFERNAGGANAWGQVAKLTASNALDNTHFGYSISVAGDTALVGIHYMVMPSMTNAGSAYVFERNAGGTNHWDLVARLVPADSRGEDGFGVSVSLAGDAALVGAEGACVDGLANAGAAYLFERNSGGPNAWGQVATLVAPDRRAADLLGYSVSLAGGTAMAGSPFNDVGGKPNAGAAYLFNGLLHGPPTITNLAFATGTATLSFDCQTAWRYDLQWQSNLLARSWTPATSLTNLVGPAEGTLTVQYPNAEPNAFYRLLRHAP